MESSYKLVTAWRTPKELDGDGETPSLWGSKGIRPAAINQGSLGDCWWLSSMAAISEWPNRIQNIITDKSYPHDGMFHFNFYSRG